MNHVSDVLPLLLSESSKLFRRSAVREILKLTRKPGLISLAGGLPSPLLFPIEELKDIVSQVLDKQGANALQYAPTEGDTGLLNFLVNWMNEEEGAEISEENILIVSGAQQALDMIGRTFIDPGDPIIIGKPSYLGALMAFNNNRCKFIGASVDKDGIVIAEVEGHLQKYKKINKPVKFIYVVPDFQNPAGVTLSLERRKHLLELCEEFKTVIVEDSPYRQVRFEGEHIPKVGVLDKKGFAFSVHTFSKILFPGMRLGWIVANQAIMEKFVMAKQPADLCTSPFSQAVLSEYCRRGLLKQHIENVIKLYRKRRNVMIQTLERFMPAEESIQWTHPQGGMFLWLTLPAHLDTDEMFPKAIQKNVAYVMGSAFFYDGSGKNSMRLNFSYPTEDQIETAIKSLAELIKDSLTSG
jgi:2-aminoadipate transaminase